MYHVHTLLLGCLDSEDVWLAGKNWYDHTLTHKAARQGEASYE